MSALSDLITARTSLDDAQVAQHMIGDGQDSQSAALVAGGECVKFGRFHFDGVVRRRLGLLGRSLFGGLGLMVVVIVRVGAA